jgi:hypothetical protein
LDRRLTAATQRCTNPKDAGYANYGGRGIEFRFPSVTEACLWVMDNLELRKDLELDRIDNNGHYEPGNLRFLNQSFQNRNSRRGKIKEPPPWPSPYSWFTTNRMLRRGLTREQVMESARLAVVTKTKCWRKIKSKLELIESTTSSTQDREIASLCLGISSTTAGSGVQSARSSE